MEQASQGASVGAHWWICFQAQRKSWFDLRDEYLKDYHARARKVKQSPGRLYEYNGRSRGSRPSATAEQRRAEDCGAPRVKPRRGTRMLKLQGA